MMDENRERVRRIIAKFPISAINPQMVEAIVAVESNYDEYAIRLEQRFYEKYCKGLSFKKIKEYNPKIVTIADGEIYKALMAMSWGPMQIMGLVAHECGFRGDVRQLLDAEAGIKWGIEKLKSLAKRKGYGVNDIISAYNDGDGYSPRDNVNYVEKVNNHYQMLMENKG